MFIENLIKKQNKKQEKEKESGREREREIIIIIIHYQIRYIQKCPTK